MVCMLGKSADIDWTSSPMYVVIPGVVQALWDGKIWAFLLAALVMGRPCAHGRPSGVQPSAAMVAWDGWIAIGRHAASPCILAFWLRCPRLACRWLVAVAGPWLLSTHGASANVWGWGWGWGQSAQFQCLGQRKQPWAPLCMWPWDLGCGHPGPHSLSHHGSGCLHALSACCWAVCMCARLLG